MKFDEIKALPKKGIKKNDILKELDKFSRDDPDYKHYKTWSLVYYLGKEHTDFLLKTYGKFFSANGLNPMAFKSLRRMEREVIKITAELLNGNDEISGVMTSCGTESCMLAVKTYRDMFKKIKKPEIILPETGHVAWIKGIEYFNIKPVFVPLNTNYTVDIKKVKNKINKKTIMILGSAPEYPHGMIDPIEELGEIALSKNIPLHVDACLGGYLLPFLEKLGYEIPVWDYRVPGVTSISADTHKYGFSAKGASTITYRNIDFLKHQFFVYENWPGGVFASPAFLGTRPGGAYAAAWASLMTIGEDGFLKIAKKIRSTTEKMIEKISKIKELEIIGNPLTSVFAYRSISSDVSIFAVGDQMEKKGWHVDRLQRPEALHVMVTPNHSKVIDEYISDLKKSVRHVKKNPELAEMGGAAMYGMIANIPLRGMVKKNVLKMFAEMYGPEAKEIDPASIELDRTADGNDQKDFSEKMGLFYLKLLNRFKRK